MLNEIIKCISEIQIRGNIMENNNKNLTSGTKYYVVQVEDGQGLSPNEQVFFVGYDMQGDLIFQSLANSKCCVVDKGIQLQLSRTAPKAEANQKPATPSVEKVFLGNKLVRYCGQGWNGGLGIRALGYPDFRIPDEVEKLIVMLPDSPRTFTLERDTFSGSDSDHGHIYGWSHLDFTCTYDDPVIGRPRKFSLYQYLGGDYDDETGASDNYVTVVRVMLKN